MAIASDFKIASQEAIFETEAYPGEVIFQKSQLQGWMDPVEAPSPKPLAANGLRGVVSRKRLNAALIIGPFNASLLLLLGPAIAAFAAGNCCFLKVSERLPATNRVLLRIIPAYFDPGAVVDVAGGGETTSEMLASLFDPILLTGSTKVGKIVAKAAKESLLLQCFLSMVVRIRRSSTRMQTSRWLPRRSSGEQLRGAVNGVSRLARSGGLQLLSTCQRSLQAAPRTLSFDTWISRRCRRIDTYRITRG